MEFIKREEQHIQIKEFFEPYATIGCKDCWGTAKFGWVEDEGRYRLCDCVLKNIEKIKAKEELVN